jgi:RNA polymerase sigma-70 factor (ECF subfamily)
MQAEDDFSLLARSRDDDAAWGALVDRHTSGLRRFFGHRVTVDRVDDLTQEVFVRLEQARRPGAIKSFRAFMYGVAWNVFKEFLRKSARDPWVDLEQVSAIDLAPRPSTLLVHRVDRLTLLEGLRRLSLPHQLVLELFYWEDLTSREIGVVLDEPDDTIRGRITKARNQLRAILQDLDASGVAPRETDTGLDDWARRLRDELVGDEERGDAH